MHPVENVTTDTLKANLVQFTSSDKRRIMVVLKEFRHVFPEDAKRVSPCTQGTIRIPLIDERCQPAAAKQRRYSKQEEHAIQAEVILLAQRDITLKSTSAWAVPCVAVRKSDGTLRLCQDYRVLNQLMKTDSVGQGDIQSVFDRIARM